MELNKTGVGASSLLRLTTTPNRAHPFLLKLKEAEIERLTTEEGNNFILKYHYSGDVMPRLTKQRLGVRIDGELLAVLTLGWGTRPLHTIKKLFPECETQDYYEIGKMCLHDKLPRNSETIFLKKTVKWIKQNHPEKKFLFTWADGIVGKVGYVYQAFSMYYGEFIWTDVYVTKEGHKIHPRTAQGIIKEKYGQKKGLKMGQRPTYEHRIDLQMSRVKGKQFRYIMPLNNYSKKLLKRSSVSWTKNYPKEKDLKWKLLKPGEKKYQIINEMPFIIKKTDKKVNEQMRLFL